VIEIDEYKEQNTSAEKILISHRDRENAK